MKINLENVNKLLGLKLTEKEVAVLLSKMGHNYRKGEVEIPAWRTDILHEHDLIEDIAIAYGYDKFEPEIGWQVLGVIIMKTGATMPEKVRKQIIKNTIDKNIERWLDSEKRKFFLLDFKEKVRNYKDGRK